MDPVAVAAAAVDIAAEVTQVVALIHSPDPDLDLGLGPHRLEVVGPEK